MLQNQYKLLVTDIDGTLMDKNGVISEIDRQALRDVRRAGVEVSLCTGRAAGGSLTVLEMLSLDGFHIFFDGALVCNSDQSEVVFNQVLEAQLIIKVCEFARSNDLSLELFSKTNYFISRKSLPTDIHAELMNFKPIITDLDIVCRQESIIMGCFVTNSAEEEKMIKALRSDFEGSLRFSWTQHPAYPDYHFINVTAMGISKGKALSALRSRLGLEQDQVVAIGDGVNDISLLSAAGLAIAMQNSPDTLKAVANYITADVEHNGVALAIRTFFR